MAAFEWKTIALEHTQAPGLPNGVQFAGGFALSGIDEVGRITFASTLFNSLSLGALWATGPNGDGVFPVVYDNQPATGVPGAEYQIPQVFPEVAGVGRGAFWVDLNAENQGGHVATAIYAGGLHNPQLLMRSGQPAPGVANGTFADPRLLDSFRANGDIVGFKAVAGVDGGPPSVDGIWRGSIGSATGLIVTSGTPMPDGVGTFELMRVHRVTDTGEVGFSAQNRIDQASLWLGTPGQLRQVAAQLRASDAFEARLTRNGRWFVYSQPQQSVLRVDADGSSHTLAVVGQPAPELASGLTFSGFDTGFAAGRNGNLVAFTPTLGGPDVDGSNDSVAYLYADSALQLIAREGDAAPGTAPGIVFEETPLLFANDSKQIVLYSKLRGPGVTNDNAVGLWGDMGDGQLQLLLRQGDSLLVNGTSRIVERLTIEQGGDERFSEAGQFAIGLVFRGGGEAGMFMIQLPEPSAGIFALFFPVSLLVRRSRRPA